MRAAIKGSMYSLRGNGAQHGGHRFHLRLSTFQGSRLRKRFGLDTRNAMKAVLNMAKTNIPHGVSRAISYG